jgi:hypothetical protein
LLKSISGTAGSLMIGKRSMMITPDIENEFKKELHNFNEETINKIIRKWKISYPVSSAHLTLDSNLEITLINTTDSTDITTKTFTIDHENNHAVFYFL